MLMEIFYDIKQKISEKNPTKNRSLKKGARAHL